MTQTRQEILAEVKKDFERCSKKGWDGYDADPLQGLDQAISFVKQLPAALIPTADVVPEPDGCISFEWWEDEDYYVSVSLDEERKIYVFRKKGMGRMGETKKQNTSWTA